MNPLIWIIDEEWNDYEVEVTMLKKKYPLCEIRFSTYEYAKDLKEFGYKADIILAQVYTKITAATIEKLECCKGIAVYGGGYDRIDIQAAKEKGIYVTNVQGYCADDIADYVLAAILYHNKKLGDYSEQGKKGLWGATAVKALMPRTNNTTIYFAGCGTIGRTAAVRAKALGLRVIGYDPYVSDEELRLIGIEPVSFEEGFKQADYVSVHIKYTEETDGIIGKAQFHLMKPTAIIINTSRGKVLVEDELIDAVEQQKIAGAIVDVIANEPPTGTERILKCDKILVTPHISYISQDSFHTLKERTVTNGCAMYEGEVPNDCVNV